MLYCAFLHEKVKKIHLTPNPFFMSNRVFRVFDLAGWIFKNSSLKSKVIDGFGKAFLTTAKVHTNYPKNSC